MIRYSVAGVTPLLLLALALALPASLAQADDGVAVSWTREVVPILKRRCAVCHITGQEPGGMALTPDSAYASIVNQPSQQSPLKRVEPGAPEQSYLLHKVRGTQASVGGEGDNMPYQAPPLPEAQVKLIQAWIAQGAQDN